MRAAPGWSALAVCWGSMGLGVVLLPPAEEYSEPALTGPPPGHPERLLPPVPLNDEERALWSQLV
ncbi:DUF6059 family protein [Kitasatospora purpeofusca]|uniref:DUF6059 family protein n=1 Tax=Kitasatospora purpeofusca TaxID=67352 RepID=UPI0036D3B6D9